LGSSQPDKQPQLGRREIAVWDIYPDYANSVYGLTEKMQLLLTFKPGKEYRLLEKIEVTCSGQKMPLTDVDGGIYTTPAGFEHGKLKFSVLWKEKQYKFDFVLNDDAMSGEIRYKNGGTICPGRRSELGRKMFVVLDEKNDQKFDNSLPASLIIANEDPTIAKERQLLHGRWKLSEVLENGKPAESDRKYSYIEYVGDAVIACSEGFTDRIVQITRLRFAIDASTNPKHMDLIGAGDSTSNMGIYKIEGDTLYKAAYEKYKEGRPENFSGTSSPKYGNVKIYKYERVKPLKRAEEKVPQSPAAEY
jgi:uncharacterized protein (TIGR03067 family)